MIIKHTKKSFVMKVILMMLERNKRRTKKTLLAQQFDTKDIQKFPYQKFSKRNIDDIDIYELNHTTSSIHIIYLHGGCYCFEGNSLHAGFVKKLHKKLSASVHYINYPLAPKSNYQHTVDKTGEVIGKLLQEYPNDEFYLSGDSAGGGLALVVGNNFPTIKGYFLLSPWLDISLTNPTITEIEPHDLFFTREELLSISHQYSEELTNPLCSPLYGNYEKMQNINIYAGTNDICAPDAVTFEKQFPHIELHLFQDQVHDFALFPGTKEQQIVLQHMKSQISLNT